MIIFDAGDIPLDDHESFFNVVCFFCDSKVDFGAPAATIIERELYKLACKPY